MIAKRRNFQGDVPIHNNCRDLDFILLIIDIQ